MDEKLILDVKKKKVLSGLPDELVWRFLEKNNLDIKSTRSDLRKFFGVFLTNKVLKGDGESVLASHISSKDRGYKEFYNRVFENIKDVQAVIDLGCGANGFSYSYLKEVFGKINYLGVEASGQLVDNMNKYFLENGFGNAKVVCMDLFRRMQIFNLITKSKSPKVILMLQVIDAMESVSKNSSKEFLLKLKDILNRRDFIIITMPMKSISGRKKFEADRKWLRDFLNKEFKLINEFIFGNERIFRVRKN
jgi:hypothetical protein